MLAELIVRAPPTTDTNGIYASNEGGLSVSSLRGVAKPSTPPPSLGMSLNVQL